MSTAEDVFYLYERNSRYYHDCNLKNAIEECSDCWNNECFCHLKQDVMPLTIGDQFAPCHLKIKCYIKPGEECPICYEQILTKTTAFITNCGHAFHKKCIFKCMETKWLSKAYLSSVRCPLCRCSLGHPDLEQRYRSSYFSYNFKNDNELDKLEDFWLTKDYKLPTFCSNGYNHYLGIKHGCGICKSYRKKGEMLYEIS
jgi:hypothetical protein